MSGILLPARSWYVVPTGSGGHHSEDRHTYLCTLNLTFTLPNCLLVL